MPGPPASFYAATGRVSLRLATFADSDLLLRWRNDPVTRRNSHSTAELDEKAHQGWLAKALSDPARVIFIGEVNCEPVGTVRCDWMQARIELSWTVAPECRGRGYGTELVRAAAEAFAGHELYAEIKAGNAASIAIARRAGMRQVASKNGVTFWTRNASTPPPASRREMADPASTLSPAGD